MQAEKYNEAVAAVVPSAAMAGGGSLGAFQSSAAAVAEEEEVDPLDAFMANHVAKQARPPPDPLLAASARHT